MPLQIRIPHYVRAARWFSNFPVIQICQRVVIVFLFILIQNKFHLLFVISLCNVIMKIFLFFDLVFDLLLEFLFKGFFQNFTFRVTNVVKVHKGKTFIFVYGILQARADLFE
jgi:hypothetical protein